MFEKHIVLEDVDPVVFYGVNNIHMQMIQALYPKLRIVARGDVIKVMGDEEDMAAFEESILNMQAYCARHNALSEEVILDIVKGHLPKEGGSTDVIVYSVTGKPIGRTICSLLSDRQVRARPIRLSPWPSAHSRTRK